MVLFCTYFIYFKLPQIIFNEIKLKKIYFDDEKIVTNCDIVNAKNERLKISFSKI